MRKFTSFHIEDPSGFRRRLCTWTGRFREICILDSNGYRHRLPLPYARHQYDLVAAAGSHKAIQLNEGEWKIPLDSFIKNSGDWIFGHLCYDLKNEIESLSSGHPDRIGFPLLHFFVPEYLFILRDNELIIGWHPFHSDIPGINSVFREIMECEPHIPVNPLTGKIQNVFSRQDYLGSVEKIMDHIQKGDIYEVNFCQEFFSENAEIDPTGTWLKLTDESPTPFSSLYRLGDKYLLCSSPERFIKKEGNLIVSQPIKGTSARGRTPGEDHQSALSLSADPKERAENIMITDLVRNDLSRIASRGTVRVNELCGVYPYPRVFQMQSDISAELPEGTSFGEIIGATFPMGSMTGAPKVKAMEVIEMYEKSRRGLYSGSVGYITPDMDFDFNVVIRSILYDRSTSNLSFSVGGAITSQSLPESEYAECMLKAGAIMKILGVAGH